MRMRSLPVSFLLLGATAAAQPGQLSGPVAGYVYDRAASALRPVRGVPGATTLGDPLALGIAPEAGFVAPRQDLAVLVSTGGATHWYSLSGNAATEVAAPGPIATPEWVVFSPSGTAAALVAGRSVQVVTGLPGSPALAGSVRLEPAAVTRGPGRRTGGGRLAVSDDGAWLLLASGNGLRLAAVGGGSSTLMPIGRSAAVAFSPASHDAAVASDGVLTWIHDAAGGASQQVVGQSSALAKVVGVAFSADGAALYAANAAGLVLGYDLAAGTGVEQSSGAAATAMEPMGAFFRLNEAGAGPLWLVDPNAGSPRVFFVPPASTSN
ncbi:MAG: hypothetical protein ACLQVN_09280 [Bryobacteraceae bacterium]